MDHKDQQQWQSDRLLFLGVLLFLFGLLIGFGIPMMANPRMGLSAHLEGVMNGMFLIVAGLIWHKLVLSAFWQTTTFRLLVYGSFANLTAVLLSAITGVGKMMPIAGGKEGNSLIDGIISFLLITLAVAMVLVCILMLTGLYRNIQKGAIKGH